LDYNIKDVNESEKELHIQIEENELIPHCDEAYKEYQKKIEIPGFRKGKVPVGMVKKLYGESIELEKLEKLANDYFKKILEEKNINPLSTASLIDLDYKPGDPAKLKIKYEVNPYFELKEYKGINFEKDVHKVTQKELDDEIKHILTSNAEFEEVNTVDDEYNIVTCDMQYLNPDGTIIIGKKLSDQPINLFQDVSQEFRSALIGSSVGDERVVDLKQTNGNKKYEHKIHLKIKNIEKINLPELSNELVSKITKEKITTVENFKKSLEENIQKYWDESLTRKLEDSIVDKIVNGHEFRVPPSMVDNLLDSYVEKLKNSYPNKKLPKDFDIQKYKEENLQNAIWQVKWFFISQRIIEQENIKIDDEDIEKLVDADVAKTGIEREKLMQYYKNSEALKDKLLSNKLMNFLLENNTIIEKISE